MVSKLFFSVRVPISEDRTFAEPGHHVAAATVVLAQLVTALLPRGVLRLLQSLLHLGLDISGEGEKRLLHVDGRLC